MDSAHDRRPWRHLDWSEIKAELDRFAAEVTRQRAHDNAADACAMTFVRDLEQAFLTLEARVGDEAAAFEQAARVPDHLDDLRRVLGLLLDVLADWELVAGR